MTERFVSWRSLLGGTEKTDWAGMRLGVVAYVVPFVFASTRRC